MIEQFAALYVNILEPLGKAFVVFVVIITVLWLLVMINDAKKGKEFITNVFNLMWKGLYTIVTGVAKGSVAIVMFVLRIINITFTAIRDFFVSKT